MKETPLISLKTQMSVKSLSIEETLSRETHKGSQPEIKKVVNSPKTITKTIIIRIAIII